MSKYIKMVSLEDRYAEATRVQSKYPGRVPIICEKLNNYSPDIDKNKYLVPMTLTLGQFIYVIRKRMRLPQETALVVFVGNTIPPSSTTMGTIYQYYRAVDNFLYLTYTIEDVFG